MSTAVAVRERQILFRGPMVRAILDDAKTQTRRIVQHPENPPKPFETNGFGYSSMVAPLMAIWCGPDYPDGPWDVVRNPYGGPGDRLWVRELIRKYDDSAWYYAADDVALEFDEGDPRCTPMLNWAHHVERDYCPSIHMPRWASRINLEVVGIRVERLQEISVDDAIAEGTAHWASSNNGDAYAEIWRGNVDKRPYLVHAYRKLWDSTNAKRGFGWDLNPWVWVIDFRKVVSVA